MAIGCKNCGGFFTRAEIMGRKPPVHPWPLTASGTRALAENQASGEEQWPCPECGRCTLKT